MKMFPFWMRQDEKEVVDALITAILNRGHKISVFDGMTWPVRKSTDYDKITSNICQTDATELAVWDARNNQVGWFWLIHGNGRDVLVDCTDNTYCDEICKEIEPLTEGEWVA